MTVTFRCHCCLSFQTGASQRSATVLSVRPSVHHDALAAAYLMQERAVTTSLFLRRSRFQVSCKANTDKREKRNSTGRSLCGRSHLLREWLALHRRKDTSSHTPRRSADRSGCLRRSLVTPTDRQTFQNTKRNPNSKGKSSRSASYEV